MQPVQNDPQAEVEQLLYTAEQASKIVSLTAHWLTVNARAGRIPHRRLGRRLYRWALEDLEKIKEMHARPAKASSRKAAS